MKLPTVVREDGETRNITRHAAPAHQHAALKPITVPYGSADDDAPFAHKTRSLRWLWITLLTILGLLLAVYIGFSIFFMNNFAFNTTVNGVNVAMQSPDQVDSYLAKEIGSYSLQIVGRESQNTVVKGSDIGLEYVADGQMKDMLESQFAWAWPVTLFPENGRDIRHTNVKYNQQRFDATMSSLSLFNPEQMKPPVDAFLTFEGNAYVITPADRGTTLDAEAAKKKVSVAVLAGESTLNLEEAQVYTNPAILTDNPDLVAQRDQFNTFVPFRIIYTLGERREVLDGNTTISWVNTQGPAPYALNSDAVWAYVADLANRYDTYGKSRPITNGLGEQKTVTGGNYGWQIDQEAEYWAIMNAFEQRLGEERQPNMLGTAASLGAQDWGTTYVEVDFSQQHMWYFVDGQLVMEAPVVTGNPNTGYATPEGVWTVMYKQSPSRLRGPRQEDGSYEWDANVSYWMAVTPDGCGFHDATWQPSFGGNAYLYRGSHGCMNMSYAAAQQLYGLVEEGTPVVMHW